MDERTMQLRLGAAVLVSIIIVIIMLTFLSTQKNLFSTSYNIFIRLNDAPGVVEGTPIKQSGIGIGRVKKVELLPEGGVLITANISGQYTLYHNQQCQLSTTILGDASLKMVQMHHEPGESPQSDHRVEPGDTLEGIVAFDPVVLIGKFQDQLATAITEVTEAATQMGRVAGSADEMIQDNRENVKAMLKSTNEMVADSHAFIRDLSAMVNDDELQESFRTTIVRLPQTLDKMDATVDSLRSNMNGVTDRITGTMDRFSGRIDDSLKLADRALVNVLKITDPLASKAEIWMGNVDNILQNLDVFTDTMVNPNGTVGLLLRDRTAYDKISLTLDRVNEMTRQMEPIVYNAQVFSEKIAQHPELLGVRGAIFPSSGAYNKSIPEPLYTNGNLSSGGEGGLFRGLRGSDSVSETQFYSPTILRSSGDNPSAKSTRALKKPLPPEKNFDMTDLPPDIFQQGNYRVISDAPIVGHAGNEARVPQRRRMKAATSNGTDYQARVPL